MYELREVCQQIRYDEASKICIMSQCFNNKKCIDDNENNCMIDIKNDIIIVVNVLV